VPQPLEQFSTCICNPQAKAIISYTIAHTDLKKAEHCIAVGQ